MSHSDTGVKPSPPPAIDARLISAHTQFGFNLFAELVRQTPESNVVMSPASVAFALSMTYNGAAGETQDAMAEALQLDGMSLEEVNTGHAALRESLDNPAPELELTLANSLWAREGVEFNAEFIERNRVFYGADVFMLNFNSPEAAVTINRWVRQNTGGHIGEIVDAPIDPLTVLFLINAVYFRGTWTYQFDERETSPGVFTRLDGTKKQVPMMSQSGRFGHKWDESFQAIRLPYGNERLSMYIFLPNENSNLTDVLVCLEADQWEQWMDEFHELEGRIALPRFTVEYSATLNNALSALGMGIAFGPGANFDAMIASPVLGPTLIHEVKHKTLLEITEEGTKAAAATSVDIKTLSARFEMIVNRPFFCAIRDDGTGALLFLGSIVDPQ